MDTLGQSVRNALRTLARSPAFAVTGVLTLGLGVGATAGIFALVDAVLLRPLPYPEPDRLVVVRHAAPGLELPEAGLSPATSEHFRTRSRSFDGFVAFNENVVDLSEGAEPERVQVALATPDLFSTLGVMPALGRPFTEADAHQDGDGVVLIGHDLWTRRYGEDPSIIGRTIELNRAPKRVIGVMPEGFGFPSPETEVWYPQVIDAAGGGISNLYLGGVARLRPGVEPEAAERELNALIASLPEAYPNIGRAALRESGLRAVVEPLRSALLGGIERTLWLVFSAVAAVLLISLANLAILFFVRAEDRATELAVRRALGASRRALARPFLAEGAVLGVFAGALAVAVAVVAARLVVLYGPQELPRLADVAVTGRVISFALATSILAGAALALLPLLRRGGAERLGALRERAFGATAPVARRRSMRLLVAGQTALGLALVVGAALMLRSFWQIRGEDPGFSAESVLTLEIALPYWPYPDSESRIRFWNTLLDGINRLPGVGSAGAATALPLTDNFVADFYRDRIEIQGLAAGAETPLVQQQMITPGYLNALRIPLLAGRVPWSPGAPRDGVLVNAAFVRAYVESDDPLGSRLRHAGEEEWLQVTGVIGDVRGEDLMGESVPTVYVPVFDPAAAIYPSHMSLAIRTELAPLSLAPSVRAVVRELDPELPVARVRTLEAIVAEATAPARFAVLALTLAALGALLLSAVGTYGVLAYWVTRRHREFGIRIALGASARRVRWLVLRQGAGLTSLGVAVGALCAVLLTRLLDHLLYGVAPLDPLSFAVAGLLLLLVGVVAADAPARRAARVDPMAVLRAE